MDTRRRKSSHRKPVSRKYPSPSRRLSALAIVIVLLLVLAGAGSTLYALHLENNDPFCSSCHTQPESTFLQRAQQMPAVDLASAHSARGVHCIECHSGPGLLGRVQGLQQGARDLIVYWQGNYPQPAVPTRPYPDAQCTKCHQNIAQDRTLNNHFHVLLPQLAQAFPSQQITCVECHQGHSTKGERKLAFLNRQTTGQTCQKCHRVAGEGPEGEGER